MTSVEFEPFAPRVLADPRVLRHGRISRVGVTMFVDIAGFTTLSERLAQQGTVGTEQLGEILRDALGGAMDAVADEGGDTLSYGGDAISAVFADGVVGAWDRAQLVADRILSIVAALNGRDTLIGPLDLSVKVGIAAGTVTSVVCPSGERTAVVHVGSGLDAAVAAEEMAEPGTIVVHRRPIPIDPLDGGDDRSAQGRRIVPPLLAARIDEGLGLHDEHRRGTTVFISLPPVSDGDEAGLARVEALVVTAQELLAELGGELIYCVGGDKGLVLFAAFGILVARADDPARAVVFVEQLRARGHMALRAGITTGLIWVGVISGDRRGFVGIVGDTANRGARLMTAAPDDRSLIDDSARRAAGRAVETEDERLILVKGRSTPIVVHTVTSATGAVGSYTVGETPVVGRDAELDAVVRLAGACRERRGAVVHLVGSPGSGKSRVAGEAARRLEVAGIDIERGRFDGYGMGRPYGPFRAVLRNRLDLAPGATRPALDAAVRRVLPDDERVAPLLAQVLGVGGAENAFTDQMPMAERSELTRSAVIRLVRAASRPTTLVLEDVHWADEASAAVLAGLADPGAPTLLSVVATRRPALDGPGGASDQVVGGEVIELGELDAPSLAAIVSDTWSMLGGTGLDREVAAQIVSRSAGSPLAAAVTCELVRRTWVPGAPIADVPLFEELLGVLTEQIDGLPGDLRVLALRAAVVGRPISARALAEVFGLDVEETVGGLEALCSAGLLLRQAGGYGLRHASLGDVLCESSSHADRDPMHLATARWLIDRRGPAREIAAHLDHCPAEEDRLRWFRAARDEARQVWSVREARRWAQRCVQATDHGVDDVLVLAEIGLVLGDYPEVEALLDGVQRDGLDTAEMCDLEVLLGRLQIETGRPESGVVHLTEAEHLGASRPELSWPLTMALCDLGRFADAERRARAKLDDPDPRVRLDAFANLGVALARRGDHEGARQAQAQAVALAEEVGDLMRLIHATGDLAGAHFYLGDLSTAVVLLDRAAQLAQRLGAHRALTMALGNQAQVHLASGDLVGARRVAAAAVSATLQLPDAGLSLLFLETPVVVTEALGDGEQALRWWERHAELERRLGRSDEAAISRLRAAALHGRFGRVGAAEALIASARHMVVADDVSEHATAHFDRAERAAAGAYEPPPEVTDTVPGEIQVGPLDRSMPEVTDHDIEELFDRITRLVDSSDARSLAR